MAAKVVKIQIVILALISYYLFFFDITEDRYNKIMCYYIARYVTQDSKNFEAKVIAIRNLVHENVHPIYGYDNRLDTVAIEKFISGIGWCDQQARVFMQLGRSIGMTSRLLFLKSSSGSSPHSVAEVLAPDKKWILVDPAHRLDLINRDGKFASQNDIRNDLGIIADNRRVKLRSSFEKRWADPTFLAIYYNTPTYVVTKEGIRFDFLKPIPIRWLRPIVNILQDRYLEKIKPRVNDKYEFMMMKARGWHLLGYYEKSAELYKKIIENSNNSKQIDKAEFYNAVRLKDEEKYEEAAGYISEILKNNSDSSYIMYLLGLYARVLTKMGKFNEADEILRKANYSLEV